MRSSNKKSHPSIVGRRTNRIDILLVYVIVFQVAFPQLAQKEWPTQGWTPIKDDALAARFAPEFRCPSEFGPVAALYYRAALDAEGRIHIAYHPVWERERNDTKSFMAFLSRALYTGGLSLQRIMFGMKDIESVALTLDGEREHILEAIYETARDYDPRAFGVKHEKKTASGPFELPLRFEVISWNHLFELSAQRGDEAARLEPEYFSPELWKAFGMWKNPETALKKNRAHFEWERVAAP